MATLIVGNDTANTLNGTSGNDVIYGFDPNGTQRTATTIEATRVAAGLNQPVFAGAPKGDTGRLFIVEKEGVIKILDTNTGQVLATPFIDIQDEVECRRREVDCSGSLSIPTLPITASSTST